MVGNEIWQKTLKNVQNETHTVGPGIWRETVKNVKYEKYTMQDLDFGQEKKKQKKTWKMRYKNRMTWNMARKLTNEEKEKLILQARKCVEKL